MCGIAGAILKKYNSSNTSEILRKMISNISHRGPDGSGTYVNESLGLAHRRLSIIDLSDEGLQPMFYANKQIVITFNGEIYNYIELRDTLRGKGYIFTSQSDTEVILAAYLEWGTNCINHFNGMWAFAIYDKKNNILFCSRDRFGVKPFYYTNNSKGFFFGSEIRQLLPFVDKIHSNTALLTDFLLTSLSDHTDETFFKDIYKLPAAHNIIYRLSTNNYTIERYYELNRNLQLQNLSEEDAIVTYKNILQDAVKLRLRADVPVATCLSGGLDSSSIASLASPLYQSASGFKFSAITAISEQESNNEASYAKQIVDYADLNWLTVKPSYHDFLDTLPAVVKTQEEPFGSTSLSMQYFVMREARRNGIPVLLDGQGGDETLLGYPKYYGSYLATSFRDGGFCSFVNALRSAGKNNSALSFFNSMFYLVGGLIAPARYLIYLSRNNYLKKRPFYPTHLSEFAKSSMDDFELQKLEIARTNLPLLLRYEDKNSMAHSIETRLPFLDYRVVETALSLPGKFKIHNGWSKWILRKAMKGKMPDTIVWRKNKLGFEAPEELWLSNHNAEMKAAILNSPLFHDLADLTMIDKLFIKMNPRLKWRLYSVALWEKEFKVTG